LLLARYSWLPGYAPSPLHTVAQGLRGRSSQPGQGRLGAAGQPQPRAPGTSLGLGMEHWPTGRPSLAGPTDRQGTAAAGLEMCPGASLGQGLMAPGLEWGAGPWAGQGEPRDGQGHCGPGCTLVQTGNAAAILRQCLLPASCGKRKAVWRHQRSFSSSYMTRNKKLVLNKSTAAVGAKPVGNKCVAIAD